MAHRFIYISTWTSRGIPGTCKLCFCSLWMPQENELSCHDEKYKYNSQWLNEFDKQITRTHIQIDNRILLSLLHLGNRSAHSPLPKDSWSAFCTTLCPDPRMITARGLSSVSTLFKTFFVLPMSSGWVFRQPSLQLVCVTIFFRGHHLPHLFQLNLESVRVAHFSQSQLNCTELERNYIH